MKRFIMMACLGLSVSALAKSSYDVAVITSPAGAYDLKLEQMNYLKKNPYAITQEQRKVLIDFFFAVTKVPEYQKNEMYTLKNEVATFLLSQKDISEDFAKQLAAMYQNEAQPAVLRDYALQFIGQVLPDITSKTVVRQLAEVLQAAMTQTEATYAGTSMIAFFSNWPRFNAEEQAQFKSAVVHCINSDQFSDLSKVPAIQMAGQFKLKGAADKIRDFAENAESTVLRLSAVSACGDFGDMKDLFLLAKLSQDTSHKSVQKAAQLALQKMGK